MSPTTGSEDSGGTASLEAVAFFCRRLLLLLVSLDVLLHIFQATMGKEEDAGDVSFASWRSRNVEGEEGARPRGLRAW